MAHGPSLHPEVFLAVATNRMLLLRRSFVGGSAAAHDPIRLPRTSTSVWYAQCRIPRRGNNTARVGLCKAAYQ